MISFNHFFQSKSFIFYLFFDSISGQRNKMVVSTLEQWLWAMYQETPIHIVVEIFLIVFLFVLLLRQPEPAVKPTDLSYEEAENIIKEWKPLPIVPDISSSDDLSKLHPRIISSGPSSTIVIDNRSAINFGTPNFLGLNMNQEIIDATITAVEKYAVGTGGPRQLYGTFDCHLELESKIADWLGTEDSVNYIYPFSTIISVMQAFVKNTDIIFVDECSSFAIHLGADLSRCKIIPYHHNDMNDLKSKLSLQRNSYERWDKCNRWVCTEGIFECDGQVLELEKLISLRKEFCLRLIIDESLSFGSLGKTGRGIFEHFEIDHSKNVEIRIGSFSSCFASLGCFVACNKKLSQHQRLASQTYVFSASPPALNVISVIKALEIAIGKGEEIIKTLRKNILLARNELQNDRLIRKYFLIMGNDQSPMIHLRLVKPKRLEDEDKILQTICDLCIDSENDPVAVAKTKFVRERHTLAPRSSIKIFISPAHSEEQILAGISTVKRAVSTFFTKK
ncbi:Serine palmitoyltransferase 1 [Tritrichomonas foetus]|uniref:serine C-palmitoyltransferase n=1 Tax=Tritrichomonas foetus TaxID=1144522 RepID=A0A1J4JIN5_9EUKA|nr:Serine palmitoyltransferase 1 [Tritrichomonas foetus]|eukprot:OHS98998.1 Serine palmitoyltransferase 1 [Tritrichomonas foetus]